MSVTALARPSGDPDALDSIFSEKSDVTGEVGFQYTGCTVTVHSDGSVEVSEV